MRLFPLFALLFSCCGPAFHGSFTCPNVQLLDIEADGPINCKTAAHAELLVQKMLGDLGAADDLGDFVGLPIVVRNGISLDQPTDDGVGTKGFYDASRGIELACDGRSLLHEMFHHIDWLHGAVGSPWHWGWDERGWLLASAEYKAQVGNLGDCPR